jgi:hypothetical protein
VRPEEWEPPEDDDPRGNASLFDSIIAGLDDDDLKRRLGLQRALLRQMQDARNTAAHAAVDGSERELTQDAYDELLTRVEALLEALSEAVLGIRAARNWPEGTTETESSCQLD